MYLFIYLLQSSIQTQLLVFKSTKPGRTSANFDPRERPCLILKFTTGEFSVLKYVVSTWQGSREIWKSKKLVESRCLILIRGSRKKLGNFTHLSARQQWEDEPSPCKLSHSCLFYLQLEQSNRFHHKKQRGEILWHSFFLSREEQKDDRFSKLLTSSSQLVPISSRTNQNKNQINSNEASTSFCFRADWPKDTQTSLSKEL